jgi:hypothetical protein
MEYRKHSRLGIASGIIALATMFVTLLFFVAWFVAESGTYAEHRVLYALFAYGMVVAPVLHLTGVGLAASALFTRTKRLFAVLGITLNLLPLGLAALCWILLIVLAVLIISAGGVWR